MPRHPDILQQMRDRFAWVSETMGRRPGEILLGPRQWAWFCMAMARRCGEPPELPGVGWSLVRKFRGARVLPESQDGIFFNFDVPHPEDGGPEQGVQ